MLQFLVDAPGHTDQGWWCRALQWGCDGGVDLSHAPIAPEISLTGLPLAVVLVVGGWMVMEWRRR